MCLADNPSYHRLLLSKKIRKLHDLAFSRYGRLNVQSCLAELVDLVRSSSIWLFSVRRGAGSARRVEKTGFTGLAT
jgi:hypothetical protein